jgi:predicted transglutaminase-like cysteine proteinase
MNAEADGRFSVRRFPGGFSRLLFYVLQKSLRYLLVLPLAGALLFALVSFANGLGLSSSVTPGLMENLNSRFGPEARGRVVAWQKTVSALRTSGVAKRGLAGEREALQKVNAFFNQVRFVEDRDHWGVEDYWASPAEMVASNSGDCEDYSIAKYYALKEIGMPVAKLRISYVRATKINQAHMVLAYYSTPEAEPWILDSLETQIKPASQRPDLIPVYSFNDEDVWLAKTGAKAGSPTQIRMWKGFLEKLEKERRM